METEAWPWKSVHWHPLGTITEGDVMEFTVTEGHFTSEEEALAEVADRGWHSMAADVEAEENER